MARLRFLGAAAAERDDGTPFEGGISTRRHPLALLALLACAPKRTLSRAKLAGLLWPERPEAAARNRLNSCVYNVRRDLGEDALVTAGEHVRLSDAVACDVIELLEAVEADDPARVVGLYQGPLLDGFYLSDTPEFEKWLDDRRAHFRRAYHESLEELALRAMETSRPGEAARHWRMLARDEPYDARLVVRLVGALEASGNTGAALRAGEEHVRAMSEEFGREPRADVVELLERIRRGEPALGADGSGADRSGAAAATTDADADAPGDAEVPPASARPGGTSRPPPEAQLRYAQGRGHLDERTESGLRLAATHFRAAIELHEEYAVAWAGLADALDMLRFYDYAPPEDSPAPVDAARRALEVDPECGEGWAALGIAHSLRQEGPDAIHALERAIELRPSHGEAYAWLGWVHLLTGRPDEAVRIGARAIEIDPLAPAYRAYFAESLLALGESERARVEARRAVEIQPGYGLARYILALVEYHRGDHAAARVTLEGAAAVVPSGGTPRHSEIRALEALCQPETDREAAVRSCLAALESAQLPLRDAGSIGLLQAALGRLDAAFDAFAAVHTWRDFAVEHVRYFFREILAPVREDQRYAELMATIDAAWGVD